jgi:putative hydrolase of the HAD superfamily
MSYEAVFVDLDDTLYPYPPCNEAGKRAAYAHATRRGFDLTRQAFDARYQAARRDVKRDLEGTAASHERYLYFKRFVERTPGPGDPSDALALGDAYWRAYVEEMTLFDGVVETLQTIREAGLAVAVVSDLTTRIQLEKLATLGIEDCVDLVLTSEETGREKPHSVMFTLPLARLDLTPSHVVMVGDDVDYDIAGGNAVGLTTVLTNNDDATDLEGSRAPDHRLDAFADLTAVVL